MVVHVAVNGRRMHAQHSSKSSFHQLSAWPGAPKPTSCFCSPPAACCIGPCHADDAFDGFDWAAAAADGATPSATHAPAPAADGAHDSATAAAAAATPAPAAAAVPAAAAIPAAAEPTAGDEAAPGAAPPAAASGFAAVAPAGLAAAGAVRGAARGKRRKIAAVASSVAPRLQLPADVMSSLKQRCEAMRDQLPAAATADPHSISQHPDLGALISAAVVERGRLGASFQMADVMVSMLVKSALSGPVNMPWLCKLWTNMYCRAASCTWDACQQSANEPACAASGGPGHGGLPMPRPRLPPCAAVAAATSTWAVAGGASGDCSRVIYRLAPGVIQGAAGYCPFPHTRCVTPTHGRWHCWCGGCWLTVQWRLLLIAPVLCKQYGLRNDMPAVLTITDLLGACFSCCLIVDVAPPTDCVAPWANSSCHFCPICCLFQMPKLSCW